MVRRPTIRSGAVFGVALGGLLAGHAMAYAELAPDPRARAAMLAATGHGYLHGTDAIAILAALAGLAIVFLGRLTGTRDDRITFRSFAVRMVAFQAIGFVVLEVAERVGAGASLGDLTRALPVGVVFQVTLALLSAGFLRWLLRVADRAADLGSGTPFEPPAASAPLELAPAFADDGPAITGAGNRGPPLLVR
jgi:hypothetical protein